MKAPEFNKSGSARPETAAPTLTPRARWVKPVFESLPLKDALNGVAVTLHQDATLFHYS